MDVNISVLNTSPTSIQIKVGTFLRPQAQNACYIQCTGINENWSYTQAVSVDLPQNNVQRYYYITCPLGYITTSARTLTLRVECLDINKQSLGSKDATMEIPAWNTVPLWSWSEDSSYYSSTVAQRQNLLSHLYSEQPINTYFLACIWNDMVNCLKRGVDAIGVDWIIKFQDDKDDVHTYQINTSYDDTLVESGGDFTAERFNAIITNTYTRMVPWKYDTTFPGYLGRKQVVGKNFINYLLFQDVAPLATVNEGVEALYTVGWNVETTPQNTAEFVLINDSSVTQSRPGGTSLAQDQAVWPTVDSSTADNKILNSRNLQYIGRLCYTTINGTAGVYFIQAYYKKKDIDHNNMVYGYYRNGWVPRTALNNTHSFIGDQVDANGAQQVYVDANGFYDPSQHPNRKLRYCPTVYGYYRNGWARLPSPTDPSVELWYKFDNEGYAGVLEDADLNYETTTYAYKSHKKYSSNFYGAATYFKNVTQQKISKLTFQAGGAIYKNGIVWGPVIHFNDTGNKTYRLATLTTDFTISGGAEPKECWRNIYDSTEDSREALDGYLYTIGSSCFADGWRFLPIYDHYPYENYMYDGQASSKLMPYAWFYFEPLSDNSKNIKYSSGSTKYWSWTECGRNEYPYGNTWYDCCNLGFDGISFISGFSTDIDEWGYTYISAAYLPKEGWKKIDNEYFYFNSNGILDVDYCRKIFSWVSNIDELYEAKDISSGDSMEVSIRGVSSVWFEKYKRFLNSPHVNYDVMRTLFPDSSDWRYQDIYHGIKDESFKIKYDEENKSNYGVYGYNLDYSGVLISEANILTEPEGRGYTDQQMITMFGSLPKYSGIAKEIEGQTVTGPDIIYASYFRYDNTYPFTDKINTFINSINNLKNNLFGQAFLNFLPSYINLEGSAAAAQKGLYEFHDFFLVSCSNMRASDSTRLQPDNTTRTIYLSLPGTRILNKINKDLEGYSSIRFIHSIIPEIYSHTDLNIKNGYISLDILSTEAGAYKLFARTSAAMEFHSPIKLITYACMTDVSNLKGIAYLIIQTVSKTSAFYSLNSILNIIFNFISNLQSNPSIEKTVSLINFNFFAKTQSNTSIEKGVFLINFDFFAKPQINPSINYTYFNLLVNQISKLQSNYSIQAIPFSFSIYATGTLSEDTNSWYGLEFMSLLFISTGGSSDTSLLNKNISIIIDKLSQLIVGQDIDSIVINFINNVYSNLQSSTGALQKVILDCSSFIFTKAPLIGIFVLHLQRTISFNYDLHILLQSLITKKFFIDIQGIFTPNIILSPNQRYRFGKIELLYYNKHIRYDHFLWIHQNYIKKLQYNIIKNLQSVFWISTRIYLFDSYSIKINYDIRLKSHFFYNSIIHYNYKLNQHYILNNHCNTLLTQQYQTLESNIYNFKNILLTFNINYNYIVYLNTIVIKNGFIKVSSNYLKTSFDVKVQNSLNIILLNQKFILINFHEVNLYNCIFTKKYIYNLVNFINSLSIHILKLYILKYQKCLISVPFLIKLNDIFLQSYSGRIAAINVKLSFFYNKINWTLVNVSSFYQITNTQFSIYYLKKYILNSYNIYTFLVFKINQILKYHSLFLKLFESNMINFNTNDFHTSIQFYNYNVKKCSNNYNLLLFKRGELSISSIDWIFPIKIDETSSLKIQQCYTIKTRQNRIVLL